MYRNCYGNDLDDSAIASRDLWDEDKGIPEAVVCKTLMFMWPFERRREGFINNYIIYGALGEVLDVRTSDSQNATDIRFVRDRTGLRPAAVIKKQCRTTATVGSRCQCTSCTPQRGPLLGCQNAATSQRARKPSAYFCTSGMAAASCPPTLPGRWRSCATSRHLPAAIPAPQGAGTAAAKFEAFLSSLQSPLRKIAEAAWIEWPAPAGR